jgi:site-specific DNA-methyltransferase (adenine-specific)
MIENWKNTEHLGDCLEIMKLIPDKSIDFICTDLPYGTTACKWDTIIPFEPLWGQYNRVIKDKGCIALFGNEPFTSHLRMSNIENYKYDWAWDKQRGSNFVTVKKRPFNSFENIAVFYSKQPTYNPQMIAGAPYKRKSGIVGSFKVVSKNNTETVSDGFRYPLTVLSYPMVGQTNKIHNTQKPVALIEYLIKTYSNENDIVLDSTAGSFTLAEACINTNRDYIVIEKDEPIFKKGSNRIKEHKQKLAERLF